MRKFFTFAAAVLASLSMMAQSYTTLYSTDFSDASWAGHDTICNGATAEETINGIFFRSANNSKYYTIANGALTFCDNNSGNAYFMAIPVQNVNDSVIVTIGTVDNSQRVNYLFRETNVISTSGVSMTSTAASINTNKSITIKYAMKTDSTVALVMLGRQGSGQKTVIKSITVSTLSGGVTPPSTDSVATATISGADSCYVGKSVTLTCTAEHATTYQWYNTNGIIEGATAKTYVFTPDAEGTYGFYCLASNQYNTNPVRSNSLIVTATIKPAAVPCAAIIPATSGDSLKVGDEVALDATSEGGKIFVAGMKTSKSSISYNALGLMLGGGGADSIRVEFNNLIAEGSVIKLVLAAGGTSERGLNLQTVAKSNQFQAKWTPAAAGEVKEFEYTVPAGSKLIGDYRILLQRNNTVYLQSVSMADCGAARPGTTVISKVETLTGVAINDGALNATDFAELLSAKTIILGDSSYVVAPVVKFTKHVVITYEDQSTKEKDEVIAVTSQQATASTWGATATINGDAYSVYTVKQLSYTVNYYDGETLLGSEPVAQGASATKYEQYSVKPLSQFVGWYTDAAMTHAVESWTVTANMNVYGKWTKLFASSVNIEQFVLDYGKKTAAFKDTLTAHGWTYSNINDLDSLNDDKTARNEPYLGLKLKAKGASVAGWIHNGDTITVKFGNVGDSVIARINGQEMKFSKDYLNSSTLGRRATADEYLELVTTSGSTVVLKQFMINENIQDVVLPGQTKFLVTCATAEHGTVKVNGKSSAAYAPGDTVVVAVTPAKGYHVVSVTAGDAVLVPENDVYSFVMLAQDVTVSATFEQDAYMVDIDDDELPLILGYNAIMVRDSLVAPGTVVTMSYMGLEAGYKFVRFFAYKTGDEATPVALTTDSTFVMPAYGVTFSAVCTPILPALYRVVADSTSVGGAIGYEALTHGTQAAAGDTITLLNVPEEGYRFVSYIVYKLDDHSVTVPVNNGKFIMPAHDVYVSGTFEQDTPVVVGYMVDIDDDELPLILGYNAVMVQDSLVAPGTVVTMSYMGLEEGYEFDHFFVYKTGEPNTLVGMLTANTFEMPSYNVTISAVCTAKPALFLVTLAATQNGTVQITNLGNEDHKFYEGETVYINVTPAEGYEIESVSLEGLELAINLDEDGNGSFNMPGQNVTLIATFKPVGEGIDDINADTKAVKRMINGVLVIEKNGKFFNAQGAELR